jgi:LDH2 family malate/lactate/ureidoglycolate dehydrogenase
MQIAADRLRELAATILAAAGSSTDEARKVAARLVCWSICSPAA